ncbi:flagellar hook-length control protein FliK [Caldimonas brevitalea]|uniref:Fe-S oxidoreductase n=1 Tax=Caldimonas brevitalea TaxID=413882 RepID=A0A0G3BLU0_9BURK|nr:flagellar hook-length control protein FliK [Caldimonas brevitalea]AKJ30362.1 Fe-S oxidoreductase [Caldimonas brevitalea]
MTPMLPNLPMPRDVAALPAAPTAAIGLPALAAGEPTAVPASLAQFAQMLNRSAAAPQGSVPLSDLASVPAPDSAAAPAAAESDRLETPDALPATLLTLAPALVFATPAPASTADAAAPTGPADAAPRAHAARPAQLTVLKAEVEAAVLPQPADLLAGGAASWSLAPLPAAGEVGLERHAAVPVVASASASGPAVVNGSAGITVVQVAPTAAPSALPVLAAVAQDMKAALQGRAPASAPADLTATGTSPSATVADTPALAAGQAGAEWVEAGGPTEAAPQPALPVWDSALQTVVRSAAPTSTRPTLHAGATVGQQPLAEVLGERLRVQVQGGIERAVIRLDPPMGGTVEIVIRHEAGSLQVQLSASHSEVARQLQTIGDTLRQDLVQRQYGDVSVVVAQPGRERDGDARQQGRPQPEQEEPGRALSDGTHESRPGRFSLTQDRD